MGKSSELVIMGVIVILYKISFEWASSLLSLSSFDIVIYYNSLI